MIFVEYFRNESTQNAIKHPICNTLLMKPLSEIRNSHVEGNFELGMYASVNRSTLCKGGGVSAKSYVSDSIIGAYSLVGSRVSIGGFEHPKDWLSTGCFQWGQSVDHWSISDEAKSLLENHEKPKPKETIIGPDCWVGNNAVILASIQLGAGSIIGAGTVVTKDVPPYSICVGNPGRIIGTRFEDEIVSELLDLQWWNLEFEQLSRIQFSNIHDAIDQLKDIKREAKEI